MIDSLTSQLGETGNQVTRLEQVFESIDKKATAKKCEVMNDIIKEAGELKESCQKVAVSTLNVEASEEKELESKSRG